jgi:hypothetical protein
LLDPELPGRPRGDSLLGESGASRGQRRNDGRPSPEREKRTFFELAARLAQTENVSEQKRLREELARMTFGD